MKGHELYTRNDFTQEEIDRKNALAVAVLRDHRNICKQCGSEDFRLPCSRERLTLEVIMECIELQQKARGIDFNILTEPAKIAYASANGMALAVEVGELVSSWPFASWKSNKIDYANISREIIDCIFFLVNIAYCFGITAEDLQDKFTWVLENNYRRMESGEHKEVQI